MKVNDICWNITARCNQNCRYCHRFLNINDLSYEQNKEILFKLYEAGVKKITWTGGECLLFPNVIELMKISKKLGIENKIISNGKLLTKETIDKLNGVVDKITLSIDSTINDENDTLGRGRYHFDEVKNVLDYIKLKQYNIITDINSVICRQNYDNFPSMIDFLKQYDISQWRLFKFMPLRETAKINQSIFEISEEDYYKIAEYVKRNSNIKNITTRVEKDMEDQYVLIVANGDIIVTENGLDIKKGNALTDDIKELGLFQMEDEPCKTLKKKLKY